MNLFLWSSRFPRILDLGLYGTSEAIVKWDNFIYDPAIDLYVKSVRVFWLKGFIPVAEALQISLSSKSDSSSEETIVSIVLIVVYPPVGQVLDLTYLTLP